MADMTTSAALRAAAARLRDGDARTVLADAAAVDGLAALLEEIARQGDLPPCDMPGVCNGCERRDDFVYADVLARIILDAGPEPDTGNEPAAASREPARPAATVAYVDGDLSLRCSGCAELVTSIDVHKTLDELTASARGHVCGVDE